MYSYSQIQKCIHDSLHNPACRLASLPHVQEETDTYNEVADNAAILARAAAAEVKAQERKRRREIRAYWKFMRANDRAFEAARDYRPEFGVIPDPENDPVAASLVQLRRRQRARGGPSR